MSVLQAILVFLSISMEHSPTSEPNRAYASREIPSIYETRRFITAFTSSSHLSLHWARSFQPIAPSNFLRTKLNIILLSAPRSSA